MPQEILSVKTHSDIQLSLDKFWDCPWVFAGSVLFRPLRGRLGERLMSLGLLIAPQ